MRYDRICRYCNRNFIAIHWSNYICSNICKKEANRISHSKRKEYYIKQKKDYQKSRLEYFLDYKGRRIYFQFSIHCGVCNWCRSVLGIDTTHTNRHHDENVYFDGDPLRNTIEICVECHTKETHRLKKVMNTA